VGERLLVSLALQWVFPTDGAGSGTNPEELLATAHAACFSMALSLGLSEMGHPPRSIATSVHVHLGIVDDIPTIERVDLKTTGDVPDQATFAQAAEAA
jgi:osmotically inducible protein OsmC